ncbi:MAG: transglutaminase [Isosphaeraceae bacterium]|jgi:transglutaminase-like putative cysteine protease|nr:MAG: transglutaminase [Isosphaeraceae bacterium]
MLLKIHHLTRFRYTKPVDHTVSAVRMAPRSDEDQTLLSFQLQSVPAAGLFSYRDGYGNRVDLFHVTAAYRELRLEATSLVRTHRRPALARLGNRPWDPSWSIGLEAAEFGGPSPLIDASPEREALVAALPRPASDPLRTYLPTLMQALRERFRYDPRVTTERTPLSEALRLGRGVCQDYAHLFIGSCRSLGIPARYVSGYVNHPGEIATHAWCQVWCGPEVEWLDLDPTTGQFVADDHVVVAIGRDYSDVPPNRGVWKGEGEEQMEVSVRVEVLERLPSSWETTEELTSQRPPIPSANPVELRPAWNSRSWPAYPDQPLPQALLYRQQGQQQQQGRRPAGTRLAQVPRIAV